MRIFFLFFALINISSCSSFINEWSDGAYSVSNFHGAGNTYDLNIEIEGSGFHGRVENVKRIGSNNNFIIIESDNQDYWILNKKRDNPLLNADEIVEGPFTFKMFEKRKKELDITTLGFSKII